jgi:hypothetical protein
MIVLTSENECKKPAYRRLCRNSLLCKFPGFTDKYRSPVDFSRSEKGVLREL